MLSNRYYGFYNTYETYCMKYVKKYIALCTKSACVQSFIGVIPQYAQVHWEKRQPRARV